MVRSLAQWTKTLSFPSRISPNRNSKDCDGTVNIHPITPPPAPPRKRPSVAPVSCGAAAAAPTTSTAIPVSPSTSSSGGSNTNGSSSCGHNMSAQHHHHQQQQQQQQQNQQHYHHQHTNNNNVPITEISQIIYPGPESENAIMSSVVFCIHHKLGCNWSGELRKLKAHLNACKHDATSCPNRCGAQIPRVMMTDHIQFTCTQRRTRCEFCRGDFSGQALEEHAGTCAAEPIYCEAKCGLRVRRGRLVAHMSTDCAKRLLRCAHCAREFSADTLATHEAQCPAAVAAAAAAQQAAAAIVAPTVHACTFKESGCRFRGGRAALEAHLEQNTAQHLSLMVALSSRQGAQIAQLKGAVAKLSTNYTGTLLWKVSEWSAKMTEARSKEGLELVSPPFYTSQYGYKLQASLFLNGNGPGEGTHMSVYIKVLPGEYDALLKWPFQHSVTFTLFEQGADANGGGHASGTQGGVAESFVPDPTWGNFQRPSAQPDALGFGFPRFVSHELMGRRQFVKDDTCFLRVKVDPSKIVAV